MERKLENFRPFYNTHRARTSLEGDTPCRSHQTQLETSLRGLYQLSAATQLTISHTQQRTLANRTRSTFHLWLDFCRFLNIANETG